MTTGLIAMSISSASIDFTFTHDSHARQNTKDGNGKL